MKRKLALALAMVFSLAGTVPAFAADDNDLVFRKEFAADSGKITVEGTGEIFYSTYRGVPAGSSFDIKISEGMQGKKLYFRAMEQDAQGKRPVAAKIYETFDPINDPWNEKGKVLSENGELAIDCTASVRSLKFMPPYFEGNYAHGTAYTLELVGGTEHADNVFYGQENKSLANAMVYCYDDFSAYRDQYDTIDHSMGILEGSDTAWINGEETVWNGKAYKNEYGVWMVPLRSAVASLPQNHCIGMIWEDATNTAIIVWHPCRLRFTEGEAVYTRNGEEIRGMAKVERKDGVIYIPLETMREFWDDSKISYGKGNGKITGKVRMPIEKSKTESK